LGAAREELLASVVLVPAAQRLNPPLCGEWTLKDLLGHIADWELLVVEGLRDVAKGRTPTTEAITDIDAWNQSRVQGRREQSWVDVENDLQDAPSARRRSGGHEPRRNGSAIRLSLER
jgi:hypothetical protein